MTTSIVKYYAHLGDRIQCVEVERETAQSVWLRGRAEREVPKVSPHPFAPYRYCDTWEEARTYLLDRAKQYLNILERQLNNAQLKYNKIVAMQNPELEQFRDSVRMIIAEEQRLNAIPTPADRIALAVCRAACPTGGPCPVEQICSDCRRDAAAVTHEWAQILRERHGGSSQVADMMDGIGCHPGTVQTVQGGNDG